MWGMKETGDVCAWWAYLGKKSTEGKQNIELEAQRVKIELRGNGCEARGKATERMRVLMNICDRGERSVLTRGRGVVVVVGKRRLWELVAVV